MGGPPKLKSRIFFLILFLMPEREEGLDGNKKKVTFKGESLKSHFRDWWWNLTVNLLCACRGFLSLGGRRSPPQQSLRARRLLSSFPPACLPVMVTRGARRRRKGSRGSKDQAGLGGGTASASDQRQEPGSEYVQADPAGAWLAWACTPAPGLGVSPPGA